MKSFCNSLIILAMATAVGAQVWPSGSFSDPDAGLPGPPPGELSMQASMVNLKSDHWSDQRSKFNLTLGLGGGLGLSVGSSMRDLSGFGAFQKGLGDTRLGLSYWQPVSERLSAGANGYFIVPTGFRKQEWYYDPAADTLSQLPPFSLGQTGGEIMTGFSWSLGPAAELNACAGYFSSADRTMQAFRWGLGAWLAPLGPRYAAELGYGQSLTRAGFYPNTETFTAALAVRVGWGFSVVPGMTADLTDDPLYGASLGLRFSAPIPSAAVFSPHGQDLVTSPMNRFSGTVLVAPPITAVPTVDRDELWRSVREALRGSFDEVVALPSLDVPGLPYNGTERSGQDHSIRAIAEAHEDASWLLISRIEREDVSRAGGVNVPLLFSRTQWTAECRLTVELINLRQIDARNTQVIEARAVRKDSPLLSVVSTPESEVLSMNASRELTLEAYREAGKEIARELMQCEPEIQSSSR